MIGEFVGVRRRSRRNSSANSSALVGELIARTPRFRSANSSEFAGKLAGEFAGIHGRIHRISSTDSAALIGDSVALSANSSGFAGEFVEIRREICTNSSRNSSANSSSEVPGFDRQIRRSLLVNSSANSWKFVDGFSAIDRRLYLNSPVNLGQIRRFRSAISSEFPCELVEIRREVCPNSSLNSSENLSGEFNSFDRRSHWSLPVNSSTIFVGGFIGFRWFLPSNSSEFAGEFVRVCRRIRRNSSANSSKLFGGFLDIRRRMHRFRSANVSEFAGEPIGFRR